jgi:hypothetical protein
MCAVSWPVLSYELCLSDGWLCKLLRRWFVTLLVLAPSHAYVFLVRVRTCVYSELLTVGRTNLISEL